MSKGEDTRNRIIQQAAPLFNKHGLAGVSIADIMAATDLQKGGIYRHFNSKEEIALAAFDYNYAQLTQRLLHGLETQPTCRHRLALFLENFTAVPDLLAGGCPVLNTAVEHDDGIPALRDRARRAADEWHHTLVVLLEAGVHTGAFRAGLDVQGTATLYLAALEGGLMLSRLHDDPTHLHRVVVGLKHHAAAQVYVGGAPE